MIPCKRDMYEGCDGKYRDCTDCTIHKIVAEIEQVEINGHIRDTECFSAGLNAALNIVKRYKIERLDDSINVRNRNLYGSFHGSQDDDRGWDGE